MNIQKLLSVNLHEVALLFGITSMSRLQTLCPVSVMATDIANTEHCHYQTSLILHGKGIKFSYSKTSPVLRKKDKYTKIVPNIVFWKNRKNLLQNSQKLCKIDCIQKCLYSSISYCKKRKNREKSLI